MTEPESNLIRSNLKPNVEPSLRRSGRIPHQSDRYYGFLIWNGDPIELDENDEDSVIYMDKMQRSESDKWFEAMKSKIEAMKVNHVWTLVDPPEEVKFIGCK